MICEDLKNQTVLGTPGEYFLMHNIKKIANGSEFDANCLEEVLKSGRSENGITGIKIMAESVRFAGSKISQAVEEYSDMKPAAAFFEYFKSGYKFIFLKRRSLVQQAVSHYIAMQTKVYHSYETSDVGGYSKEVTYDYEEIAKEIKRLEENNSLWRAWFKKYSVEPLVLFYEDCAKDINYVDSVINFLGVDSCTNEIINNRRLKKLADSRSSEFVERFKKERASRKNIDQ